jgi:predicted acylesterase/phospholipase RssA
LPKGIVTGVQLETVLRRLAKAKGFHKFDELPIVFRAVATDLVTGKPVVFSEGELANVMRASMSVPGAVAPAEFGGMMLVDGMLTSNLPSRRRARWGRYRHCGQRRHAIAQARTTGRRPRRGRDKCSAS